MLIEKYMTVPISVSIDEYDYETVYEEVEVDDYDIRQYIDNFCNAEDVINFAKQIAPEEFNGKNSNADLDLAYDVLIDEFDEHDDIPDIRDLREYIEDCVYQDYQDEASEQYSERTLYSNDDEILDREYRRSVL